jgi:hypothetical protein
MIVSNMVATRRSRLARRLAAGVKICLQKVRGSASSNIRKQLSARQKKAETIGHAWNRSPRARLTNTVKGGPAMANLQDPNESYRPGRSGDEIRDPVLLDNELQPDPELAEGPASSGRITLFAIAIAVVLGIVFYGLNNTSMNTTASNTATTTATQPATANPTQNTTAQNSSPPVAPGVRDVTPHRSNTEPGTTTGTAPAQPQQQPAK